MYKKLTLAAASLACLALSGAAHAGVVTFDAVGDADSLVFQASIDGATLSTTVNFRLDRLAATQAIFAMAVGNDSSGPGQNAFMSFGIDVVAPSLTGVQAAGGGWEAEMNKVLPTFSTVDLCVFAANGCSGGKVKDGLAEGDTSAFLLTLTTEGNFLTSGITFTSPYGAKFQSVGVGGGSYEFSGCFTGATCGGRNVVVTTGTPGTPGAGGTNIVPEPGSLALVMLALMGAAAARRGKSA